MKKIKHSLRDLDLTQDKLLSKSNVINSIKSLYSFEQNFFDKPTTRLFYGTECIKCGAKISYGKSKDDEFLFVLGGYDISKVDPKDLKELCFACDDYLEQKCNPFYIEQKDSDLLKDFHKETIENYTNEIKKDMTNRNVSEHNMATLKNLWETERREYVTWARKNKVDIW